MNRAFEHGPARTPLSTGLHGHSITYRIALGPRAGQKAFTLQSLPGALLPEPDRPFLAKADGFSLHAGIVAGADERKKVERLCRYIARPAIATGRLSLTAQGQVRYTRITPWTGSPDLAQQHSRAG